MIRNKKVNNELIRKRRKKRLIRNIFILTIFVISLSAILCFKLPYFNITQITVHGNKHSSIQDIVKESKLTMGGNTFYSNLVEAKKGIKNNPYIDEVNINRHLPSTLEITITERTPEFYVNDGNISYIIDNKGYILENQAQGEVKDLIPVNLGKIDETTLGTKIIKDNKKLAIMSNLGILQKTNKSSISITNIDITNILDVRVNCNDICIYLGDYEALQTKLNKAINILLMPEYKDAKGYIDLRFDKRVAVHIDK